MSSLLEGVVMLVIGLMFHTRTAEADWGPVEYALAIAVWTFRGGGLTMLGISLLCYLGWRNAPLVDTVASALIGLLLVASGATLVQGHGLTGLLILLFGLMSLHAARGAWRAYRSAAAAAGARPEGKGAGQASPSAGALAELGEDRKEEDK